MTTYKPRPSIVSPFQRMRQKTDDVFNVRDNKQHPVRAEIAKCVGTINLTATIEEDSQTLSLFKHVPGLIAFTCHLKRGDDIIGVGRGASVLNKVNKYVEKSVHFAVNASLIDSVVRATKILDMLRLGAEPTVADNVVADEHKSRDEGVGITPKQQNYLLELIQNISDEDERARWESQIGGFTREDASEAIQSFVNAR
ncbi:MAG: hypothetical protein Q7S43_02180 [bacterium]|nr:hypothetical protein [bacterium]